LNTAIRRVALALGLLFLILFANLNYVQLARSRDLTEDPRNRRNAIEEEGIRRGEILAADGTVLAESVPSGDPQFRWDRRYPAGALFGHVTGYYTSAFFCGSAGLEQTKAPELTGRRPSTDRDLVDELLGRRRDGNVLKLTLEPSLQAIASAKFGTQRGGVAVIDTETGAVLALYGTPGYDPNLITRERQRDCARPKQELERDPDKVLLSRAFQVRYPPGSTFKIVTAAAGLEAGLTPATTFPNPRELDLPDTDKTLGNFGGSACRAGARISIAQGFRISCNTTFAQVAMRIGREKLVEVAKRFGIASSLGFDLPVVPSCIRAPFTGNFCDDPDLTRPFVAYSGIGQGDVRMTPLQMALVGAVVANGGYVVRPYVVQTVLDASGKVVRETEPRRSKRIYSARTARQLREMMIDVVRRGTGAVVRFRDARKGVIGGKTGTAQTGIPDEPPHVWFVAWGPGVAVAVAVENGGSLRSEATGGKVAGPIAKALLEAATERRRKP
jgi:peptidoglycan glycosyltransferase